MIVIFSLLANWIELNSILEVKMKRESAFEKVRRRKKIIEKQNSEDRQ